MRLPAALLVALRPFLVVLWIVMVTVSCGTSEREVRAHYDSGALESLSTEVQLEDGSWIRDGPFEAWHANGSQKALGSFDDGRQAGTWTQWHPNDQRGSVGGYHAGLKEGPWEFWHQNGERLAAGEYRGGEQSGPWTHWHPDGSIAARGSFVFGSKEGPWVYRNPDGTIEEELTGLYEENERVDAFLFDGTERVLFEDDSPSEETRFVDGVRDGPSESWYPNGSLRSRGRFADGRKTGEWTHWKPDGTVDASRTGTYDGWNRVEAKEGER